MVHASDLPFTLVGGFSISTHKELPCPYANPLWRDNSIPPRHLR